MGSPVRRSLFHAMSRYAIADNLFLHLSSVGESGIRARFSGNVFYQCIDDCFVAQQVKESIIGLPERGHVNGNSISQSLYCAASCGKAHAHRQGQSPHDGCVIDLHQG